MSQSTTDVPFFILAFILADLIVFNPTNYSFINLFLYKLLPNFIMYVVDGNDFPCVLLKKYQLLQYHFNMYSSSNFITLYSSVFNVVNCICNLYILCFMFYILNIKPLYLISLKQKANIMEHLWKGTVENIVKCYMTN